MTLDEFIKKYTGVAVDFDGVYGVQCMDLMHQYMYDVLEIKDGTVLSSPTASQTYTNFRWGNYFKKIDNTPTGIPLKGDIVFFGTTVGSAGHVCVFVDGDMNKFNSFDANWPVGSLPHIQNHNYVGVLGWLRFIPQPQATVNKYETAYKQIKSIIDATGA